MTPSNESITTPCERCNKETDTLVAIFVGLGQYYKVCNDCWIILGKPINKNTSTTQYTGEALDELMRHIQNVYNNDKINAILHK